MSLLVPNNGEGDALKYFVNKSVPEDLVLKLFKNNITPAETDTAATYTEADFTGYGSIVLTGANWTVTEGAPSDASYAQQTLTSSANQTTQQIYGYFLVRSSSGRIAWVERFADGPYPVSNLNDKIQITPKITGD
jgi:hypothetical protein